jgi:hypothetical protein
MKNKNILVGVLSCGLGLSTFANERLFTYSYEPETMPEGAMEFEQWVTLRTGRTKNAGVDQQSYNRFDLREEFEFGVTDNYTVSLYLNTKSETFREFSTGTDMSEFSFEGISIENRYMVLNPAEHAVGLTLYLEPRYAGSEAELEQKIILGQRHGDWKWALNLTHATEWEDNFHSTEGELEVSAGLAYNLNSNWAVGLEIRDHNELPDYSEWENTALYLGPVVSYRQEKWWAALTIMPQIYGANFSTPDPDGISNLELEGHERVNVRLMFGISF